jgi:2-dehydro-3-deoxygluconokinase
VAARKHGIVTVADLNYRKLWTPDEAKKFWKRALPLVDICIANDEDAPSCLGISYGSGSLATGIEEKDAYVQIADELVRTYGVKMVASVIRDIRSVEDSDWMGMIYADGKAHFSSVHHMHVLEGVAGGDAFAAGLIHALLHGMDYDAAASYAIAASVLKLTIKGDSNFATAEDIAAVAAKGAGLRVSR